MANDKTIWEFLKSQGLNDYGAAGLMGNLYAESGLSPTNLQNTYNNKFGMTDDEYTAAVDAGRYGNFVHDSARVLWHLRNGLSGAENKVLVLQNPPASIWGSDNALITSRAKFWL